MSARPVEDVPGPPARRPFPARLESLSRARWIAAIAVLTLVPRLLWCIALAGREPRYDERAYIARAERLAGGQGYVDGAGRPETYWPVGFPAVLAAAYRVAGESTGTGIALQLIVAAATVLLVGAVGGATFGPGVGRLAAILLALYPTHIVYATLQLTEPLFALLLLATTAFLLQSSRRMAAAIPAGLLIGFAALVRPAGATVILAAAVWYATTERRRRAACVKTLLVAAGACLVFGPWLARNHGVTGRWLELSSTGGHNFWIGNHPGALGGSRYAPGLDDSLRAGNGYDPWRGYRLGFAAIRAKPLDAAVRAFRKVTYFVALETDGVMWNLKGLPRPAPLPLELVLLALANAAYVALVIFAILGCVARGAPGASFRRLVLLLLACSLAVAIAFVGDPRYHHALIPFVAILAASGWRDAWPRLHAALRRGEPGAKRELARWGVVAGVFLALVAMNLLVKWFEFRSLGA